MTRFLLALLSLLSFMCCETQAIVYLQHETAEKDRDQARLELEALQADPECAEPMQLHDQVLTICRCVPELRELTKKAAFNPIEYREIAPGYYLLCTDVGSGAYLYHIALVRYNDSDDTWTLIDENRISSSGAIKYIHHKVKDNQYQVEILLPPNKWVSVFTGTFPRAGTGKIK